MRDRIDAPAGRAQYARRFATVEPVFANLRANKRLDRFTLRGRAKVDTQWKLYCLVHNIEKLANNGYASDEANRTDLLRPGRPGNANLARNPLPTASRF
jgi:hypothetical protein